MARKTLTKQGPPTDRVDGYAVLPNEALESPSMLTKAVQDGYTNLITGIGDYTRDKTYGGQQSGPAFLPRFLTGPQCEDRWRGSDLGGRIIETIPNEMTREGWEITIQPDDATDVDDLSPEQKILQNMDDFGGGAPPAALGIPAPPHQPGALPDIDDESSRIVEALELEQRDLGARHAIREALCYERAFGGGAVFLGVDDGNMDLTTPLDLDRIRSVKHLTAYQGGWDGELVAWRYYNDPRKAKFGEPEIYQLRNLGVPIAMPPAPGEKGYVPQMPPAGPTGALVFYVHESRLLIFGGTAVSRRARVQMRGWGDTLFMRCDETLSQFGQTWGGIAILMQEWSQGVLSIEGLAALIASNDPKAQGKIVQRAQLLQITQSIARMRLIDAKEKYSREMTPMSGVSEVLSQFSLRLAAAAGMPVSMLMGQVKGGLGDAGNTDMRFFNDQTKSAQVDRLMPQVRRLTQIQLRAKQGPTKGIEPKRWNVTPKPLYQLNEQELAELRNKQATTDVAYVNAGVVSAEEVAASRFGGSDYSTDTVLDLEGRQKMGRAQAAAPALPPKPPGPGALPPGSTDKPLERPGGSPPVAKEMTGGPGLPEVQAKSAEGPATKGDAGEQPRVPAGQKGGGEFGSEGGGASSKKEPEGHAKAPAEAAHATEGSGKSETPAAALVLRASRNGGFTFNAVSGKFPKSGYSVSIHQDRETVIPADHALTMADVEAFAEKNTDLLKGTKGAHFGAWHDEETGKTYLDVSHIEKDRDKAIALARANNQEGIYDLAAGKTIITKAEKERRR